MLSSVCLSCLTLRCMPDPRCQSQMQGLQSRMSSLGQQINDMYKRAENSEELAVAGLTARLQSTASLPLGSISGRPASPGPPVGHRLLTGSSLSATADDFGSRGSVSASRWASKPTLGSSSAAATASIRLSSAAVTQKYLSSSYRTAGAGGGGGGSSTYETGQVPLPRPAWVPGSTAAGATSQYASPARPVAASVASMQHSELRGGATLGSSYHPRQVGGGGGSTSAPRVSHQQADYRADGSQSAYRAGGSAAAFTGFQETPAAGSHRGASYGMGLGSLGSALKSGMGGDGGGFNSRSSTAVPGGQDTRSIIGAPSTYDQRREPSHWDMPPSGRGNDNLAAGGGRVQQQEEERLRNWIQEMRHERRRLEDRLLMGDAHVREGHGRMGLPLAPTFFGSCHFHQLSSIPVAHLSIPP